MGYGYGFFGVIFTIVWITIAFALYWSPTITALFLRHRGKSVDRKIDVMGTPVNQMTLVAVLNLFGFIVLPWWAAWVALLWNPQNRPQTPPGHADQDGAAQAPRGEGMRPFDNS